MSVTGAVIVPHPPLIIPEVGHGEEKHIQATVNAFREAAEQIAELEPEVLVIASPHTVCYADYFHISPGKNAHGDMSAFRAASVKTDVLYDEDMRREIICIAEAKGLFAGTLGERDAALDHGTLIPLYFLKEAGVACPVVRMGLSGFSPSEHYSLGKCVLEAAEKLNRRTVFVASGDLSHKLTETGPYGYAPEGPIFDKEVTDAAKCGDFLRFLSMDTALSERAAECGLRSFQIMAGALDGMTVAPRLLSYEGPFGVGYAVAVFEVTGKDGTRRFEEQWRLAETRRLGKKRAAEDPWVKLARLSLETYVKTGKILSELPDDLPQELTAEKAGAFVSLHIHGRLRGCIGTILPVCPNVAEEIVKNAVSAGTEDPRFPPLTSAELEKTEYKVDVLGRAEAISSADELDVKRYGVIVSCGSRRGLLLPDLDGVDTPGEQVAIAREKGGIRADEDYKLERFEVVRHT